MCLSVWSWPFHFQKAFREKHLENSSLDYSPDVTFLTLCALCAFPFLLATCLLTLFSRKIVPLKLYTPGPLDILLFLSLTSCSLSLLPDPCHNNSPMKIYWELLRVSLVLKFSYLIVRVQLWGFSPQNHSGQLSIFVQPVF